MEKPDVNILADSIRKAGKVQRVVEFQCPYAKEFYVKLAHANKFIMNQINDFAREENTDFRRGRDEVVKFNEEKLRQGYAEWIIVDWKGLTGEKLQEFIPGAKIEGASLKQEIPYSIEVCIALFEVSLEFETWVVGTATQIKNYTKAAKKQEEKIENLK